MYYHQPSKWSGQHQNSNQSHEHGPKHIVSATEDGGHHIPEFTAQNKARDSKNLSDPRYDQFPSGLSGRFFRTRRLSACVQTLV